jgi:phosphopantothenoylcysteine decarboxylase/phosphopantothenate--cysteine ligase
MRNGQRILLIIGGGIAACKSLDLIRRLAERGCAVRCILTAAAQEFITPLAAGRFGERAYGSVRSGSGSHVGHIRPAHRSSWLRATRICGQDGGRACGRSCERRLLCPQADPRCAGMNRHVGAWQRSAILRSSSPMASGGGAERGRWLSALRPASAAWPAARNCRAAEALLGDTPGERALGQRVVVASGRRTTDRSVRYIANRSSGKQGHAIAAAAAAAGAEAILVSGPVNIPDPPGVKTIKVETADDMLRAIEQAMPAHCAIFAAAVADWRVAKPGREKIKKDKGRAPARACGKSGHPTTIAQHEQTSPLVIGFAAGIENRRQRQGQTQAQGLRLIVANDVSRRPVRRRHQQGASCDGQRQSWPPQPKGLVARAIIDRIATALAGGPRWPKPKSA